MVRSLAVMFLLILGLAVGVTAGRAPALTQAAGSLGPFGGPVQRLLIDPQDPRVIYAGTPANGLFVSTNGGASWQPSNQGLPGGAQVEALVADPQNPSVLYVAVRAPGIAGSDTVFKTVNSGLSWLPAGAGLPPASIVTLVADPLGAGALYAATAAGLYHTGDGGTTWTLVSSQGSVPSLTALLASPQVPQRLFAGLGRGLARSDDGGATWVPLGAGGPAADAYVDAIVADPQNPLVLYAATNGRGVLRTTDGGATWQPANNGLTSPYVFHLTACPADSRRLYAGTAGGAFRSLDGGLTWTAVTLPGPAAAVYALACSPADATVAYAGAGAGGIYVTRDGGQTWTATDAGLANLASGDLLVLPSSITLLDATGDGLQRSTDGGVTWQGDLLDGAPLTSLSMAANGAVYAGVSGAPSTAGGVARSDDGGLTWSIVGLSGACPCMVRASSAGGALVYVATSDGALHRSIDGGTTWQTLPGVGGDGRSILALAPDSHDPATVVAAIGDPAGAQVLVSRDAGMSWTRARGIPAAGDTAGLTSLVADPARTGVFYAAGNGIYRSVDHGQTWQAASLQGVAGAVLLGTSSGLFAAVAGSAGVQVFRSTDIAATWQQVALPATTTLVAPLGALALLPLATPTLVIGGGHGVVAVPVPPILPTPTPTATPVPTATSIKVPPSATPTATDLPAVSGLRAWGMVAASTLWYVPLSAGGGTLTLFNPHPTAARLDLAPGGDVAGPPVRLTLSGWQTRSVAPGSLWPALARTSHPALLTVRASRSVAVSSDRTLALDATQLLRPAAHWYLAGTAPSSRAWIFNMGHRTGRVQVTVYRAGAAVRRFTVAVPVGPPAAVSLPAAQGVAATVDALGSLSVLVAQDGPDGVVQSAVAASARAWYFARIGRAAGDTTMLTVFNPTTRTATLALSLCDTGGVCLAPQTDRVNARTVRTLTLPLNLVGVTITATAAVVVQAAVSQRGDPPYWEAGATSLTRHWVVPGALTLFNPAPLAAQVVVQTAPAGIAGPRRFIVGGGARLVLAGPTTRGHGCTACSLTVDSSLPLVVGQGLGITETVAAEVIHIW